jgi:MoaA/NifB/PqqE/SkfB family radical SAM enzyme
MSNIVALRSLQCKDHAENIPPRVLTVLWNMTKRCNYDCEYCNSFIHDAVSPFVDMDQVRVLLNSCQQWCGPERKIKWAITGGEPFLDPNFIQVLELLHSQPYTEQINTISNGSLPLEKYLNAAKFATGITFSLHFERSDLEIEKTIKTIVAVKKQTQAMISVNVMALPGSFKKIQSAITQLEQHGVAYVVRLITPIDKEADKIKSYVDGSNQRKTIILKSIDEQTQHRQLFRNKNDHQALNNIQNYYDDEELMLIEQLNNKKIWQNVGVWLDNGAYQEVNTDQLVSTGKNRFKNWICYAGVDSIYIDWDGTVLRGLCGAGGPIGHINNFTKTSVPVKCHFNVCGCNIDIAVRKASNESHLQLITGIPQHTNINQIDQASREIEHAGLLNSQQTD